MNLKKSKYISSAEPNYLCQFEMRYPVDGDEEEETKFEENEVEEEEEKDIELPPKR